MKTAVKARGLTVSYDDCPVVRGVSLDIREGEFLSILGPNGAGKTTLVRALTGIIKDVGGEVLLSGKKLHEYSRREFARSVSFLPQMPPVSLPFVVSDIVMMGRFPYLRRFEMEKPRDAEIVRNAMRLMGIEQYAKRHLMELSGGEVKRVFIAQAVAQESDILFLDEPTAGLDIAYQAEIFKMLRDFNENLGKTIVLVTHDINHAARFAGRIILFKNGSIAEEGKPEDVVNEDTVRSVFSTEVRVEYDNGVPYVLM